VRSGWLYTGDLGCLRKGHLWITGRQKNVIVSAAGKNIYPEELEERLAASPLIQEVLVFGRKKEGKQGEEVRALIVPDVQQFETEYGCAADYPGMSQIREQIGNVVAEVNLHVADYKRITGFEVQHEELEKTSTKKVKRFLYK
jgi:long-chain acyl-CoA synthetase